MLPVLRPKPKAISSLWPLSMLWQLMARLSRMLAVSDDALLAKIEAYKDELKAGVEKKKEKIEKVGYETYMKEM